MAIVTPEPRGRTPEITRAWNIHAVATTVIVHCNTMPRYSTATLLDAAAARALGVVPFTPGRRPAPRFEWGCRPPPPELTLPSGALARDLLSRAPQARPISPDGGPAPGPGPNPPGLDPLPPPIAQPPPMAPAPPSPIPPIGGTPPVGGGPAPPPPGTPAPIIPQTGTGWLRTIPFTFTGDIAGGDADSELRAYGPIERPFIIREVLINPVSSLELEQFVDIFVCPDADNGDIDPVNGGSIFARINSGTVVPAPDNESGVLIGTQPQKIDFAFFVTDPSRGLKVQTKRRAGALTLPNVDVVVVIEEFDWDGPRVIPRPGLPPVVPPAQPPAAGPSPTPLALFRGTIYGGAGSPSLAAASSAGGWWTALPPALQDAARHMFDVGERSGGN